MAKAAAEADVDVDVDVMREVKMNNVPPHCSLQKRKRTNYFNAEVATSVIDQRETDLIRFALKRWKLPGDKRSKFSKIDSFQAEAERRKESE